MGYFFQFGAPQYKKDIDKLEQVTGDPQDCVVGGLDMALSTLV